MLSALEDTRTRLWGQHVPQAPCTAHGQMNFVFSAPVCLVPSRRPQDSLLKPFCAASVRSPGQTAWRTAHLDEVGSGADSDNNSTSFRVLPSSGQKIAHRRTIVPEIKHLRSIDCGEPGV